MCSSDESRAECPLDCCLTRADGMCSWFGECGAHDPDCCSTGACFSASYTCSANQQGESCYPGRCLSGACESYCSSFDDCASGFCGTACSSSCVSNGELAPDFESCCECYSGSVCQACNTLSVEGIGFLVYRGRKTSFPLRLHNASASFTSVSVSVSGPLRDYVSLESSERVWNGLGFSRINPGEVLSFSTGLQGVPDDLSGVHPLKYSFRYSGGSSSHVVWVAVLPVQVMQQGREPPSKSTVGVSRSMMRMSYEDTTVPVEVVMQVW